MQTSGLARKKSEYLDLCSAASTASPSSLGLVKVGLLATHSPAPPFQTQLPHPWTAAKKRLYTMLFERLLAKLISTFLWRQISRSSYFPDSVWLVPPRSLHSYMPGPAGEISPQRGRRCHSLRLLLLSDLHRRLRSRWKLWATAMTLGSRATTLVTDKGMNPQDKVC